MSTDSEAPYKIHQFEAKRSARRVYGRDSRGHVVLLGHSAPVSMSYHRGGTRGLIERVGGPCGREEKKPKPKQGRERKNRLAAASRRMNRQ